MRKFLDEQGLRHLLGRLPGGSTLTTVDTPDELADASTPFTWARNEGDPQPLSFEPDCAFDYAADNDIDIFCDTALLAIFAGPANMTPMIRLRALPEICMPEWDDEIGWHWPMLLLRGREGLILFMAFPDGAGSYNLMAQRVSPSMAMSGFVYTPGQSWQWVDIDSGSIIGPALPGALDISADLVLQLESTPGFWTAVVEEAGMPAGLYVKPDDDWHFIGPSEANMPKPLPPPQFPTRDHGVLTSWWAETISTSFRRLNLQPNGPSEGIGMSQGDLWVNEGGAYLLNFSASVFQSGGSTATFQCYVAQDDSATFPTHRVHIQASQFSHISFSQLLWLSGGQRVSVFANTTSSVGHVTVEAGATLSLVKIS